MTPREAYYHCAKNGRNAELEKIISTDSERACYYAQHFIKGRWPMAENVIATDPRWAFQYAQNVIEGRWPEGENVISTDPQYAYYYAREIINGRWIEGEKIIATDPEWAFRYHKELVKKRWFELEQILLKNKNRRKIVDYCKASKERWPEIEPLLSHSLLIDYCNYLSLPLPVENYNRELLECAIHSKESKYFNKIKKEKDAVIRLLESLISRGLISKNQTVEELISHK